ncbi:helicase with zinc finger domain 2 isoform X1 [Fundulus heteroclitus]|uniref:helicase with zinc finger domain 2 isoform X1 n=2 Tax=Fundulus heteroclitus TaxID=8078 RepID=UPI00165AF1C6|nr:helicase with zinc finger domain 2 isoform X1 [Fundulus heteroclitus]
MASLLSELLLTHELSLACDRCCIQDNQITFRLRPVQHQCAQQVLLCRAKEGRSWRPVSKRPTFPNPKQYEACWHFKEGLGCTVHKNRCTFAKSQEEAAVWTFEKKHGVDHQVLCAMVLQSQSKADCSAGPECRLSAALDLKAACDLCSNKVNEVTYSIQPVIHKCSRSHLLAKGKASNQWKVVSERPTGGNIGSRVLYKVCDYFVEGSGCSKHTSGDGCTYARSSEEATVWNHLREKNISRTELIREVSEAESAPETPEHAAQSILQRFSGKFLELCRNCFLERPTKLSPKRWNDTCCADTAHTWEPILVHHLSDKSSKQVYSQVRPLPTNCRFNFCSHVRQGKPCWHQAGHCQAAQSEVEMAVWKAEHSGLSVRPPLLQLSQQNQVQSKQVSIFCKVCLLALSSPESFYKHCSTLEHAQLLSQDTTTKWRKRQPPHHRRTELWLCDRPETCEYGSKCPKAHSEEELQEWMMRSAEEQEIRRSIETQGLMCYNQRLLDEYRNSSSEAYVLSEQVDDVSVSCDEDLTVQSGDISATLKWNFLVDTERQLLHVALLKQEPGASFSLADGASEPCIYSAGESFLCDNMTYAITVSFTSTHPGLYEQWLVLDFDMRPVLLKKLRVRVGQPSLDDTKEPVLNHGVILQSVERWNRGNRLIIPCSSRTEKQEELLKEYKSPQIKLFHKSSCSSQTALTADNYKAKMHEFLYNEERAEDKIVSRLNVCGKVTTADKLESPKFGMEIAPHGELFCSVSIPYKLTMDSPEGLVLKRSVHSALIAPLDSLHPNSKVYEARVLQLRTSENQIHLQMSKQCCSDLALEHNQSYQMEVQFQMDRYSLCSMHKAVDLLPDTTRVLPDLKSCAVPVSDVPYENMNSKQRSALSFITGNHDERKATAPLLIYGPFGTGKTFTMATAAIQLCKHPQNKVLICTHTNSSADLYVGDHFHLSISKNNGLRPIRIKANSQNALWATDEITLKYCFLSEDRRSFLTPTKAVLEKHNVVVTTTTMAGQFHDLKLAEGFFTHILIDEASQMLECEALLALSLAGPNTRVILAGDHMQMGPQLFSVDEHRRSDCTLLTRLFHYYQGQECDTAQRSRIIFTQNYRSTKEIVEFVSTNFYVGKNDVIEASGNVPAPPNGHALRFHHVRGECSLDTISMSWYNKQESFEVAEVVKDILKNWPSNWGPKNLRSICVLSEGPQVRQIRTILSRKGFSEVNVETLANVQGKQFRAVIMSAVQTRDSLKESNPSGLPLFNDARVLNTAMTRAQSQVTVVGDAAALCCFGKCSKFWQSFIIHCISSNSVEPPHYTKAFFDQDVVETGKFQRVQGVDEGNAISDSILQELRDEYEQVRTEFSSDEEGLDSKDLTHQRFGKSSKVFNDRQDLMDLCEKQPKLFKKAKLVKESHNRGYVVPFHKPTERVHIQGRSNIGKAFTGDEVVIQAATKEQSARVVGVIKENQSARELVCFLEEQDHSRPPATSGPFVKRMMIPINKSATKIAILIKKDRRNFLPIWEQNDEQWTIARCQHFNEIRDKVFLVQVIGWKDGCFYPLGNVTDVLSSRGPFNDRLWLLKEEFGVKETTLDTYVDLPDKDENSEKRQNKTNEITFTVDPERSKDLDDAISIGDAGTHYELGIHIADVASYVRPGDKLDRDAEEQGSTQYTGEEPIHMFPKSLSTGHFSLLPHQDRRAVSLMIQVEKETHRILEAPTFQFSVIRSKRQFTYEEAEDIINQRYRDPPAYSTVEDCVTVAYHFAKAQRKLRLASDWPYYQSDDDRLPGKRKAHQMIEEISLFFNSHAAKYLCESTKARYYTPLRCQSGPEPERVDKFKDKCGPLLQLSFGVRQRLYCELTEPDPEPSTEHFPILEAVWNDIQSALRDNDEDKLVDLVAADDIHPLLQPVMYELQRCHSKAYYIRSNSTVEAKHGHYSLRLNPYSQASSPIRRYMDLVLQRLLHSFICDSAVPYTRTDITDLCHKFEPNAKKDKQFEQKAQQISYAVSTKKQSAPKLAFAVSVEPEDESLKVTFPFNRNIFHSPLSILLRELQLEDQPIYKAEGNTMTLTWKRRIYAADDKLIHQELSRMSDRGPSVRIPLTVWTAVIKAVQTESLDQAKFLLMNAKPQKAEVLSRASSPPPFQHYADIVLQLQPGDTIQVQMTSEEKRGSDMPIVQLLHIKPKFEICVQHVHNPILCYTRSADQPTKAQYRDEMQYIEIWEPMCKMESAANAVEESDSIIIENLEVNFTQQYEGVLTGKFFLHEKWIKDWVIECHLAQCFLCIRKRGLKLLIPQEHSAPVDPKEFTWVAHGVTTKAELRKTGCEVKFSVCHLPMESIPEYVFLKNAVFTAEIIPKLLPDIRKEQAVVSLGQTCNLVKRIALGHKIPKKILQSSVLKHQVAKAKLPAGLPELNDSQLRAVAAALNGTFTLIQGPPGTGKTVVGVNIVWWFLKQNSKTPRKYEDPKDKMKKEVILYCGPSNKSVDVVAEYLMKFEGALRILRVYGLQVEMVDYPYPNSDLQFSLRSLRPDGSKPELRSITMHHRMREPANPSAAKIKEFDERIRSEKVLTAEEEKEYKDLLKKARIHELKQHDIILCTCTQSSTPILQSTVSARQILIDESAMATEPQALIPLVFNKPEQVVLIGDHKQLQPIVKNQIVKKLGMSRSLFERYYTILHGNTAVMLDTQYRMHKDICEFPSEEFYDGKLKTGVPQPSSVLLVNGRTMPLVFGHIEGETVRLVVKTAKGNNNSKANHRERDQVTRIAGMLVEKARVDQENIVVLSPYNAQVSEIKEELRKKKLDNITVTTITKSQGSEWRYVILSTVCSVPRTEIVTEPDGAWMSKHVGFVGDPHQINVAITRAKEGLCIIGNQALLRLSTTWRHLLEHYTRNNAVTDADKISVLSS